MRTNRLYQCESCEVQYGIISAIRACEECGVDVCSCCEVLNKDKSITMCNACCEMQKEIPSYRYPEDFYDFSNGMDVGNDKIKCFLNEIKNELSKSKEEWGMYQLSATGNTFVLGMKLEDEYRFIVAKGYQDISVEKDDIDKFEF